VRGVEGGREEKGLAQGSFGHDVPRFRDGPRRGMPLVLKGPRCGLPVVVGGSDLGNELLDAARLGVGRPQLLVVDVAVDVRRAGDVDVVSQRLARASALMHVAAHEGRGVAGLLQELRHGGGRDGLGAEAHDTACLGKQAGQQRVACGDAGRHAAVGPAKEHPASGQLVQVRRTHDRVFQNGQTVPSHLVGHEEQDIGLDGLRCGRCSARGG